MTVSSGMLYAAQAYNPVTGVHKQVGVNLHPISQVGRGSLDWRKTAREYMEKMLAGEGNDLRVKWLGWQQIP